MNNNLVARASRLRDIIAARKQKLVCVESCTGGWIAASMATLPGISQWWCGSLVVYRSQSKHEWLGIEESILDDPHIGPVSEQVTIELATQALLHTSEAEISIAVTGDLGPGVAFDKDGRVFCAIASRGGALWKAQTRLTQLAPRDASDIDARVARLEEASSWVLDQAINWLGAES